MFFRINVAIVVRTDFSSVFVNQTSLSFEFKRLKLGQLFAISNKANIHLKSNFIELWRDQMLQQTNGKLRTYIAFKSNFDREKYLSVLNTIQ
jgi:hypothetical protein